LAGASAVVLTGAALLYAPIPFDAALQGPGMVIRTQLVLAVVIVSAIATWMLAMRPENQVVRLATSASSGFNLVWIFSFVGLSVVLSSMLGIAVATVPGPRRLGLALVAVAVAGFALGLLMMRLTQPPGEHIFA
jgi:hypothetical protein